MRLSNNFTVQELVHEDIINVLGEKRAANLVDVHLIKMLERLRNQFGAISVNGMYKGRKFTDSGVRKASFYKNKLGFMRESYSTHQYGNTVDAKFHNGIKASDVYDYILANQAKFPYIVRMENAHKTKTWLHIECGRYREDDIGVFNP